MMDDTDRDQTMTAIPEAAPGGKRLSDSGESRAWYSLPADVALEAFSSSSRGLAAEEAAHRRDRHGPNELPAARGRSALARLLAQFDSLLIYVLLASALIAALLGHWVDAAVILAVVVLNGLVGFIQEGRAEKAIDSIHRMLVPNASVLRDGQRVTVAARDLVPGDVVLLTAGDRVPSDLRLLRARNLQIQEAILTGESVPVEKTPAPAPAESALGDRPSMAFSGTLVTSGQGAGVVVATGPDTELGRISAMLRTVEKLTTPLLRQINVFARWLTGSILLVAGLVLGFAVLVWERPPSEAFMAMVGMAVAAIPEGLPAVITVTLAIGVQRMASRNAIIRRLPAVETLGSVSIICSDKTGTLTRNEMTVRGIVTPDDGYEVTGVGYEPHGAFRRGGQDVEPRANTALHEICRVALLCNDAALRRTEAGWSIDGDPMEGALVVLAAKAGFDPSLLHKNFPRIDEIPFDAEHRFMATLHHSHDGHAFLCVKGAPEDVIRMCEAERADGRTGPIDHAAWTRRAAARAAQGERVLALAMKDVSADKRDLLFDDVSRGMTMLGLLALIDPPREEAITAVGECRTAGIDVKMITGDHSETARAIARQICIPEPEAVRTDSDLERLDGAAFSREAARTGVFARISPANKLRLVQALQANGAVVAMTGDGVNDAPALKRADIGIAMGVKGTEVAKEAAEMVLADDNFASIIAAVREGRTVYDNIKKVIAWTLPTNGGEAFSIIAAVLLGLPLPITAVQILWINMVTAVALGLTLAFEPTEPGTMRRPPRRPDEPLLSGFLLWRVILVSIFFVAGVFTIFSWARNSGAPLEQAHTLVVNAIVAMEIAYLFSIRYLYAPALTPAGVLGTWAVILGVASTIVLQIAFTYLPAMGRLFGTQGLDVTQWAGVAGLGVLLFVVLELEKWLLRGR